MPKLEDLTGQKFGRLTAKYYVPGGKNIGAKWFCECECGGTTTALARDLKSGHTQSCGCRKNEMAAARTYKDLTGQKFGRLIVIEDTGNRTADHNVIWKCLCDCGKYCEKSSPLLVQGKVHSCGCLRTSVGEDKIIEILTANNIPFEREKFIRYKDGSTGRFDFFVNNLYAIEYDGVQHFEYKYNCWGQDGAEYFQHQQQQDEKKNEYCKENNIPLIRIPYTKLETLSLSDLII